MSGLKPEKLVAGSSSVALTLSNALLTGGQINGVDLTTINNKKSNFGAGSDPGVSNDNTETYGMGSIWTTTAGAIWFCTDAGTGAAVWKNVSGASDNAILTDIAGLTQAQDKGIYFDSASTAATFDLTAAGLALLDDADASAQRTTLGLAIGTNVQAYHARLADIAALGVTADNFVAGNASNLVLKTPAQARTSIGLDTGDNVEFAQVTCSGLIVTAGPTTVSGAVVQYEDSLFEMAKDQTSGADEDALDTGFFSPYRESSTTKYRGAFFDATDGKFKIFDDLTEKPGTIVSVGGAGFTAGTMVAGTFEGDLTGTVTGDVTGNVTGDVTGDLTGTADDANNWTGTAIDDDTGAAGNIIGSSGTGYEAITIAAQSFVARINGNAVEGVQMSDESLVGRVGGGNITPLAVTATTVVGRRPSGSITNITPAQLRNEFGLGLRVKQYRLTSTHTGTGSGQGFISLPFTPGADDDVIVLDVGGSPQLNKDGLDTGQTADFVMGDANANRLFIADSDENNGEAADHTAGVGTSLSTGDDLIVICQSNSAA